MTAKNVECIIDPKGKQRSPDLLGGAFQRHFLCRVDERAGVIHLTPGDSSASVSQERPGGRALIGGGINGGVGVCGTNPWRRNASMW
jgi:hypothetical protein